MFTGIVKAVSTVAALEKKDDLLRYAVEFSPEFHSGLELGASVSVDGVCQTVVAIQGNLVWFEAIEETLRCSTLSTLALGKCVNLERSAKIGDEIGGHLLSGHIFGTASLVDIHKNSFTFACTPSWAKYLFPKGFIAIDGISLTLGEIDKEGGRFTVHLIPETLKRTTLSSKKLGDLVNLEFDASIQAAVDTIESLFTKSSY